MQSERQRILSWFYREVFPAGVLSFDDLHLYSAIGVLGKSSMDAEAYVQKSSLNHWNVLMKSLDYDRSLGRKPIFRVIEDISRRLIWFPNSLINLPSRKDRRLAIRLRARPLILRMIDQLSDREYEAMACVITQLAGAARVKLTPPGKEGGIDLFAVIKSHSKSHIFGGPHRPLRIIGQAKKYRNKLQVDEVKELITTIEEVKNQNPSVEHLVPSWFRTAQGPVIGWIIAHNGLQSGGVTKARNHGIIVSDSIDLAEISTLSRHINENLAPTERVNILKKRVKEFLSTN